MIRRSVFVAPSPLAGKLRPRLSVRTVDRPTELFSSNDLSAACRVSLRQLQWWDEKHVIQPRHEGHRRIYSLDDAVTIAVIAALRRRDFSLQVIRLRILKKIPAGLTAAIVEKEQAPLLVVGATGRDVWVEPDPAEAIDTMLSMKSPAIVLNLAKEVGPLLFGVNGRKK